MCFILCKQSAGVKLLVCVFLILLYPMIERKNDSEVIKWYIFGCWLFLCFVLFYVHQCIQVHSCKIRPVWYVKHQNATTKTGFNSKLEAWQFYFRRKRMCLRLEMEARWAANLSSIPFKMFLDWNLDEEIKFEHIYILWTRI